MLERDTEELRGRKHRGSLLKCEGYGTCILDGTSARCGEILRCLGFGRAVGVHAATVGRRNLAGKLTPPDTTRRSVRAIDVVSSMLRRRPDV